MKSGASFYLAVIVALVFAATGICWALAALALILGSLARPKFKR
jgi:hypothetical protein